MKLLVGDTGFYISPASDTLEMLTILGNLLLSKPLKMIDEIIYINFNDRIKISKESLDSFILIPFENYSTEEKRRAENMVRNLKIEPCGRLLHKDFTESLRNYEVAFFEYLFPEELTWLYKELQYKKVYLYNSAKEAIVDGTKNADQVIKSILAGTQMHKETWVEQGTMINLMVEIIARTYNKALPRTEGHSDKTVELVKEWVNKTTREISIKLLKEAKNNNELLVYNHPFVNMIVMHRMDQAQELLSSIRDEEKGADFRETFTSRFNAEFLNAFTQKWKTKDNRVLNKFKKLIMEGPDPKSREVGEIKSPADLDNAYMEIINEIIPEYLFEILDENTAERLKDLRTSQSKTSLLVCRDRSLLGYILEDALRDCAQGALSEIYLTETVLTVRDSKSEYLVVYELEDLDKNDQMRIYSELKEHTSKIKALLICCKDLNRIHKGIRKELMFDILDIPSYDEILKDRYKIFIHLINRAKCIDKKSIEALIAASFHFKNTYFDYLNKVSSFDKLRRIITELTNNTVLADFDAIEILYPPFWLRFDLLAEKLTALDNKPENEKEASDKIEYTVKYIYDKWQVMMGREYLMLLNRSTGLEYLLCLIQHFDQEGMPAETLYKKVRGEEYMKDGPLHATISRMCSREQDKLSQGKYQNSYQKTFIKALCDCEVKTKKMKKEINNTKSKYNCVYLKSKPKIKILVDPGEAFVKNPL